VHISELLTPEATHSGVSEKNKKRVLEYLGKVLADQLDNMNPQEIFQSLIARERLGSTAIGHGVAIPHARLPHIEKTYLALIQLKEGIDFDSPDKTPVDLICGLVVPEKATDVHLQILASLAKMFSDPDFRQDLRTTRDDYSLYQTAIRYHG